MSPSSGPVRSRRSVRAAALVAALTTVGSLAAVAGPAAILRIHDEIIVGSYNLSRGGEENAENVLHIVSDQIAGTFVAYADRVAELEERTRALAAASADGSGSEGQEKKEGKQPGSSDSKGQGKSSSEGSTDGEGQGESGEKRPGSKQAGAGGAVTVLDAGGVRRTVPPLFHVRKGQPLFASAAAAVTDASEAARNSPATADPPTQLGRLTVTTCSCAVPGNCTADAEAVASRAPTHLADPST